MINHLISQKVSSLSSRSSFILHQQMFLLKAAERSHFLYIKSWNKEGEWNIEAERGRQVHPDWQDLGPLEEIFI